MDKTMIVITVLSPFFPYFIDRFNKRQLEKKGYEEINSDKRIKKIKKIRVRFHIFKSMEAKDYIIKLDEDLKERNKDRKMLKKAAKKKEFETFFNICKKISNKDIILKGTPRIGTFWSQEIYEETNDIFFKYHYNSLNYYFITNKRTAIANKENIKISVAPLFSLIKEKEKNANKEANSERQIAIVETEKEDKNRTKEYKGKEEEREKYLKTQMEWRIKRQPEKEEEKKERNKVFLKEQEKNNFKQKEYISEEINKYFKLKSELKNIFSKKRKKIVEIKIKELQFEAIKLNCCLYLLPNSGKISNNNFKSFLKENNEIINEIKSWNVPSSIRRDLFN